MGTKNEWICLRFHALACYAALMQLSIERAMQWRHLLSTIQYLQGVGAGCMSQRHSLAYPRLIPFITAYILEVIYCKGLFIYSMDYIWFPALPLLELSPICFVIIASCVGIDLNCFSHPA